MLRPRGPKVVAGFECVPLQRGKALIRSTDGDCVALRVFNDRGLENLRQLTRAADLRQRHDPALSNLE
jgi:hypothetical protein